MLVPRSPSLYARQSDPSGPESEHLHPKIRVLSPWVGDRSNESSAGTFSSGHNIFDEHGVFNVFNEP
jgi:hypothetical protein